MTDPLPPEIPLVDVPKSLLWDYAEAPKDPMWRLQRIASRFPALGRDRATVAALYLVRHHLKIPLETLDLIEIYEEKWRERLGHPCQSVV